MIPTKSFLAIRQSSSLAIPTKIFSSATTGMFPQRYHRNVSSALPQDVFLGCNTRHFARIPDYETSNLTKKTDFVTFGTFSDSNCGSDNEQSTIWIHFGFLTDVIVERLRNEIERPSARPQTLVRLDEILTIQDSISTSLNSFSHMQDQPTACAEQVLDYGGPISTFIRPKTRGVQSLQRQFTALYWQKMDKDCRLAPHYVLSSQWKNLGCMPLN